MGGSAVVIGGGLAGTLAVAALLDHVDTVTVVERDRYPDGPVARKGVPQGRHLHVFLPGGQHALEALLPGTVTELERAGARRLEAPATWSPGTRRAGSAASTRTGTPSSAAPARSSTTSSARGCSRGRRGPAPGSRCWRRPRPPACAGTRTGSRA
ncbi:FAD/NAD(P)-binding protein [Streptomyces sp. M19]